MLLSVSEDGVLAFWVLEERSGGNDAGRRNRDGNGNGSDWRCTETIRTGRKGFRLANCSSAKKSALGMFIPLHLPSGIDSN